MADPVVTSNGTGPWYVQFIRREGISTAFAAILLAFVLTSVFKSLQTSAAADIAVTQSHTIILEMQARILQILNDHNEVTQETTRVLQALCYNSASTPLEVQRCTMAFTGR